MCSRTFETRPFPNSLAATGRSFTFYVVFPKASFDLSVLPIYVTRVPAAPFARSYPRRLYLLISAIPLKLVGVDALSPSARVPLPFISELPFPRFLGS
jgi:hypothetical protein